IALLENKNDVDWFVPIVADAEAGFGGPLNVYELIEAMIEAGAAGVHLEDQLASEKKCGHMGGKVLVPTRAAIAHLIAARLAADVCDVPTLILARTDANAAALLTTNADERDREFLTGDRTLEGFFRVRSGLDQAIARGLSYAPFADLIWCETSQPKNMDTVRPSISTKWAPATSTTLLRLSPPVIPPPRRCEVRPNKNNFIEPHRDGFVGSRGFNRQPPGRALRRGGAERVPRLRGVLRRDHAAGARSFSGARLARQLQRRGRETASLFARARWPNESRRKLVGRAFA